MVGKCLSQSKNKGSFPQETSPFIEHRHGTPVAYLVNTEGGKDTNSIDKFEMVMQHWKEKYSDCFLSQEEEQEYFEQPRQSNQIRHIEDFE